VFDVPEAELPEAARWPFEEEVRSSRQFEGGWEDWAIRSRIPRGRAAREAVEQALAPGAGESSAERKFLSMPRPLYPARCARLGHAGRALVEVLVTEQGKVRGTSVVESAGCVELDDAACAAAREARFEAGSGEVRAVVSVVFRN
jgi:TonB family protein